MTQRTKTSPYRLALIANDFQIPFHDEKALLLFKMFLRRERPDWLILNGDFQDFWEISSYDLTPRGGKDFKREIEIGRSILRSFRRSLSDARITGGVILRTRALPVWLAWVGLVIAALCLATIPPLTFIAAILLAVWVLVISVLMIQAEMRGAPAGA